WNEYIAPSARDRDSLLQILNQLAESSSRADAINELIAALRAVPTIRRRDVHVIGRRAFYATLGEDTAARTQLHQFLGQYQEQNSKLYTSHLHIEGEATPLNVPSSYPVFEGEPSF